METQRRYRISIHTVSCDTETTRKITVRQNFYALRISIIVNKKCLLPFCLTVTAEGNFSFKENVWLKFWSSQSTVRLLFLSFLSSTTTEFVLEKKVIFDECLKSLVSDMPFSQHKYPLYLKLFFFFRCQFS